MEKARSARSVFKDRQTDWYFCSIALAMILTSCSGKEVREEPVPTQAADRAQSREEKPKTAPKNTSDEEKKRSTEASAEYHFSLAQAYVAEGSPDRAIEEYKLTLMYDPNSALVYTRLAMEYVKKGMLTAAMESCKEALQRDPNFIDARLMLAGLHSTARETDSALAEYDRILKVDPKHEEAAVYKSQVFLEDGRPAEAATFLRTFLKRNNDSTLAWYYLGRAEQSQDHFEQAVSSFKKAIALKPSFSQAGLALGFLYEEKGKNAQAIEVYRSLYEDSRDLAAANRLATIYLKQEKYDKAIPFLEAVEASDPDDLNVRVKLGLVRMELKQYEQAIGIFTKILERNPESDRIHYYLGSLYEEMKQFDQAISHLKQIKAESKLFQDATLHVAYLYKQNNRLSDARSFIREAIKKSPKTSAFYIFQASMEEDAKSLKDAIAILEDAGRKFPEDEKVLYYLGSLYDRQGSIDKGLEQMEAILKVNPENVDALNYIGYTWTQRGIRLNDAEKLLRRALALRPDNGYIQDSWGWYLFVRGKTPEAVVELEKAAQLKPNEPTILEHLGDAYLRSNLREKALSKYREAAKYAEDEGSKRNIEAKAETVQRELAQGGGDPGRVPAGTGMQRKQDR